LLLHLGCDLEGSAHFLAALSEQVIPLDIDVIQANLVGLSSNIKLELLDQAAGFGISKALRIEHWPVADAAVQVPDVHEVEVVDGPGPRHLRVVDLESAVGGHPRGLDGGDVRTDYLRQGELVGDVAGTRSQWRATAKGNRFQLT